MVEIKSNLETKQWIMLTDLDVNAENPTICKVRHPKSDEEAMFMFNHDNTVIREILTFEEGHRSWFIEETVQSDGSLLLTTKVDPLLLSIPYLVKASQDGKYRPLDQIFEDDEFPECRRLIPCCKASQISLIADCRGPEDLKAYSFNKDKTLKWLKCKVLKLANLLEDSNIHVIGGAVVGGFQKTSKASGAKKEDFIRFAHGIISDYLSLSMRKDLQEYLGLEDIVDREEKELEENPAKRLKTEDITPLEDYSNNGANKQEKKTSKLNASQTKLNKVDKSGMKSLSSFFSSKPKAK